MSVQCTETYVPICQFLSRWSGFQMGWWRLDSPPAGGGLSPLARPGSASCQPQLLPGPCPALRAGPGWGRAEAEGSRHWPPDLACVLLCSGDSAASRRTTNSSAASAEPPLRTERVRDALDGCAVRGQQASDTYHPRGDPPLPCCGRCVFAKRSWRHGADSKSVASEGIRRQSLQIKAVPPRAGRT